MDLGCRHDVAHVKGRELPKAESMVLDLFPLQTVLFPRSSMPLHVFEPRYLEMIGACMESETPFGIILLKSGRAEGAEPVEIYRVGTTANIFSAQYRDDGTIDINVTGRDRFEVLEIVETDPRFIAEIQHLQWTDLDEPRVRDLTAPLTNKFAEYLNLVMALTGQWLRKLNLPEGPVALAEYVSAGLQISNKTRQIMLEQTSVAELMSIQLEVLDAETTRLAEAVSRSHMSRSN